MRAALDARYAAENRSASTRSPVWGAIRNSRATAAHPFDAIAFPAFLDQLEEAFALELPQMVVHFLPGDAETAGKSSGGIGLGQLLEQPQPAGLK